GAFLRWTQYLPCLCSPFDFFLAQATLFVRHSSYSQGCRLIPDASEVRRGPVLRLAKVFRPSIDSSVTVPKAACERAAAAPIIQKFPREHQVVRREDWVSGE